MRPRQPHALSGNRRDWSPRRCFFLDTETGQEARDGRTELPLRLWLLRHVWRDKPPGHPRYDWWAQGRTGLALAEQLERSVTSSQATWLWAHNLGFDLVTTRLPLHLEALGWEWTAGTLTADAPWVVMRRGNRRLTMVDSHSHLPTSLRKIGDALGLPKLQLPAPDADLGTWDAYTRRDVEILSASVLQLLDWWDRLELGSLSVTGAQTGWNSWRHMCIPGSVRIDADADTRGFCRRAIYGGRRDVWRVGELHGGPWLELDYQLAHAHLVRDHPLPIRIRSWFDSLDLKAPLWRSSSHGAVADCVIRSETPRYPLQSEVGVLYPVGTFRTRLAWPELLEAHRRGELLSVGRGLICALGRPMQPWASWLIEQLTRPDPLTPPAARLAMKGWSRTCIGKWAARTSRLLLDYPDPAGRRFAVETGSTSEGLPTTTVYLGGRARAFVRDQEADDALPIVYTWITSLMRVTLARLVEQIGEEHLVLCNTDSVVVTVAGLEQAVGYAASGSREELRAAVERLGGSLAGPPLGVKAVAEELRLRTPDHVLLGPGTEGLRKLASVPANAVETDPWVFEGDTWPGLAKQLSMGQGERFVLIHRRYDVNRARPLRWVDGFGRCLPVRIHLDESGANVVEAPDLEQLAAGFRAGTRQHPQLLRVAVPA